MKSALVAFVFILTLEFPLRAQTAYHPDIPRVWDDAALADWATPVAGLNVRPTHITRHNTIR